MSGVKGRSGGARPNTGGARPGAGRPPKPAVVSDFSDPLEFLRAVWQGTIDASPDQVRAASAALPYLRPKIGDGGKKEAKKEEAEKLSANRFTPSSPPRLVAVK